MIKDIFSEVLRDNFSGSGQVLLRVQQALVRFGQEKQNPDLSALLTQLERLERHFPHFALLFHFLGEIKTFLERNPHAKGRQVEGFVRQYQSGWENVQQRAAENLLRKLSLSGKNILLHSNSSAIHSLFHVMAAKGITATVWQTVSSPADEGLIQAAFLKGLGFDVHVFHEDAVSHFVPPIDLAIFGADLLWEKFFLNKIGTLPLALALGHFHKPVYVLAESRKRIDNQDLSRERLRLFIEEPPKPAKELAENPVPELQLHNYYFEKIPLSLTKGVFMEEEKESPLS